MKEELELVCKYEWEFERFHLTPEEETGEGLLKCLKQNFDKAELKHSITHSNYYDGINYGKDKADYGLWHGSFMIDRVKYNIQLHILSPSGIVHIEVKTKSLANIDKIRCCLDEYISSILNKNKNP